METLKGVGPFTVFAPTDEAFSKLPKGTVEDLLKPENKAKLTAILTYHVVAGKVMASDVTKLTQAKTVQGGSVRVSTMGGGVMIDAAHVAKTDIATSNGDDSRHRHRADAELSRRLFFDGRSRERPFFRFGARFVGRGGLTRRARRAGLVQPDIR